MMCLDSPAYGAERAKLCKMDRSRDPLHLLRQTLQQAPRPKLAIAECGIHQDPVARMVLIHRG